MTRESRMVLAVAFLLGSGGITEVVAQTTVSGTVRNGGSSVSNAAVYLIPLDPGAPAEPEPITIDQVHLNFVPRVAVVSPGTDITFLNSDDVLHNVFGPGLGDVQSFDLGTYPRNSGRSWVFTEPGLHIVLCHIHPEMAAYIIVAPTRFKTITKADGVFELEGVPPGRYQLRAWHVRHWRNEVSTEVLVTTEGLSGLDVRLGGGADSLTPRP